MYYAEFQNIINRKEEINVSKYRIEMFKDYVTYKEVNLKTITVIKLISFIKNIT